MTTPPARDCTVRCEITIKNGWEARAETIFFGYGWVYERQGSSLRYLVDIPVSGSRTGAGTRARQELLEGLSRHGVRAHLQSVVRLNAPDQRGDRLPIHEIRDEPRLPRLERLLVACGRRDTGDSIQAASREEADYRLVVLVNKLEHPRTLGWRRRFGQRDLPSADLPAAPEPVLLVTALLFGSFFIGLGLGLSWAGPFTLLVGLVLAPLLATGLSRTQRRWEGALTSLLVFGAGLAAGLLTGRERWWVWPTMLFAVWVCAGLKLLVQNLSLTEKLFWLLPMVLPVLVPLTAQIGDLAYGGYLGPLGLSREAVQLGLWERLWAAALPFGAALTVALTVIACLGWLRHRHIQAPASTGLLVALSQLVLGAALAAQQGADAARTPEQGFKALRPLWACAAAVESASPTRGAALPEGRPLLYLELARNQVALWGDRTGPGRGLIRVSADKVMITVVERRDSLCPTVSTKAAPSVPR